MPQHGRAYAVVVDTETACVALYVLPLPDGEVARPSRDPLYKATRSINSICGAQPAGVVLNFVWTGLTLCYRTLLAPPDEDRCPQPEGHTQVHVVLGPVGDDDAATLFRPYTQREEGVGEIGVERLKSYDIVSATEGNRIRDDVARAHKTMRCEVVARPSTPDLCMPTISLTFVLPPASLTRQANLVQRASGHLLTTSLHRGPRPSRCRTRTSDASTARASSACSSLDA